ncbi:o-succinylbenzoate synthase [Halobacteriales archaeon QS_1_68_20]|nr:MAG: o-succinylbenzoate synthase [Halobacteriales archaeon QS_1_68_20]
MTATGLEPFSLPLSDPLETAAGTIDAREGFLVRIEVAGEVGVGEAAPLPGWTEPLDACRTALERALEAGHREGWEAAFEELALAPAARHGVSLALADARSRAAGVPLYRHLGGDRPVEYVPVNATVGDGPAVETAAAARRAVDAGFGCLKVKVGARKVAEDVERVRAVREAVGEGIELRADTNGAWRRTQARRALSAFAEYDVAYVEQPLPADDLRGLHALRGGPVDVAVDESIAKAGIEAVLAAEAADVAVIKPASVGGPDLAREAAGQALSTGVAPVVTTAVDAVYGRTAAVHVAASLPRVPACGLATADRFAGDLAPDPAPVRDGEIKVPQRPGTGVEPPGDGGLGGG